MTKRDLIPVAILVLLAPAIRVSAQSESTAARDTLVLRRTAVPTMERVPGGLGTLGTSSPKASYSVELSQIPRLQGLSAFYRAAVDITNNTTNGGVVARINGKLLDASTRNKLEALRRELAGAGEKG